jgi:hypothetical protein
MGKERDLQTPGGVVHTLSGTERDQSVVEDPETHEMKVARFARILDNGYINDRFYVETPPGVHGEWVANDYGEISRMKALGFTEGDKYVTNRTMHHDGTKPQNIDVVFMVQPKEDHELFVKMRQEKFDSVNKKGKTRQIEEERYAKQLETLGTDSTGNEAVPVISESSTQITHRR